MLHITIDVLMIVYCTFYILTQRYSWALPKIWNSATKSRVDTQESMWLKIQPLENHAEINTSTEQEHISIDDAWSHGHSMVPRCMLI